MKKTNATTNSKGNAKESKTSVYQMVTDKIIKQLEEGVIPWEKPWTGVAEGAYNRKTKKPYSLINQCMLSNTGEYASFKQWTEMGGKIKKGAKSEFVVFWKILPVKESDPDTGDVVTKHIPLLRYYNVFHISQVEGVEPLEKEELNHTDPIAEAEELITAYTTRENMRFQRVKDNRAFYSPMMDYVSVPLLEQFPKVEEAYSTYFHELTHSTGHKSRLDRFPANPMDAMFGSESYSKEELVAEMGAAMILNRLGIETVKSSRNNAAYIQSWLKVLKGDVRFVTSAASKAEKAVKFIYGESQKGEGNDEE